MIISEYYGHVRKLINHPEAAWILDDIYRQAATKEQKAMLLREWYGPEFAIFKASGETKTTATLSEILDTSPEKRQPIMTHLYQLINQLVQKKLTGFTMLHDAMLQYYLNCKPGSSEAQEFLELLKGEGDKEEKDYDLLKNLAFTASGSYVVCMGLAYGTAKDRRNILRVYKDMAELLEYDEFGHRVLLTACEVVDDTVASSSTVFPKLLVKSTEIPEDVQEMIISLAESKAARIPLLSALALETAGSSMPKWLLPPADCELLRDMHAKRTTTSKKDPSVRRKEIIRALSPALLATVTGHAQTLAASTLGSQFLTEVLLAAEGDNSTAFDAVANLASGDPTTEGHFSQSASAGRMFKTLVQGGHYDATTKQVHKVQSSSAFCEKLFGQVRGHVLEWATGPGAFVILALTEQDEWSGRKELLKLLKKDKQALQKAIEKAESAAPAQHPNKNGEDTGRSSRPALAGMKLLLGKLDA